MQLYFLEQGQMNHDTPPSIFIKITKLKFISIQEIRLVSAYLYSNYLYQIGQDWWFGIPPAANHSQRSRLGFVDVFHRLVATVLFRVRWECFLYSRFFVPIRDPLGIHGANGIFTYISHIFTYIWLICMGNVGKYTVRPMDPMGYG